MLVRLGRTTARADPLTRAAPVALQHTMNETTLPTILRFFTFGHLPERLQTVSRPFCELAGEIAARAPDDPETLVALRKLLEAKDAAVRAALA